MTAAHSECKPAHTSAPLRVGCVSYLNTRPLIEGVEKLPGVELVVSPPAGLAEMLAARAVDAALISIIDAARAREPVVLLPCGVIASDGPTHTVRVLMRTDPGSVRRVRVDKESHTSVALMRIILAERYGVRPEITEIDAQSEQLEDGDDALLVIGDKAETGAQAQQQWAEELDLGAQWKELTGLPFVYAAWAVRAEDAQDPRIGALGMLLDRQRRHNGARLAWIAARRAGEHGWGVDRAREYLRDFMKYGVTDGARAAVDRLFELAAKHALAPDGARAVWAQV